MTDPADTGDRRAVWTRVAALVSPVAVATALLFYFGRVRLAVQATELGFDISLVDLSPADYVVRSVSVVFLPAIVLVALLLVALPLHERLVVRGRRWPDARRAGLVRALRAVSWVWLAAGLVAVVVGSGGVRSAAVPVALTALVLTRIYAAALAGTLDVDGAAEPGHRRMLWWVLLVCLLFWDTERLAHLIGQGYATAVAEEPERLTAVTVFSAKDLGIAAPGVSCEHSAAVDVAYPHRCDGLRLLLRTGDRYLLINQEWTRADGRVLSLRESDAVRLEFHAT
jgi:hypothetical protein